MDANDSVPPPPGPGASPSVAPKGLSIDDTEVELATVIYDHLSKLGLAGDLSQRRRTVCALLRLAASAVVRSGVSGQVFAALAHEAYQVESARQRELVGSGFRPGIRPEGKG